MSETATLPETNARPARALWAAEAGALVKLGAPVVFTQLAQMSIGTTDVVMLAAYGQDALATVSLVLAVYYSLWMLGTGPTHALAPMIAHVLGAKPGDRAEVRACVRMGLWAALGMSVPLGIVFLFTPSILHALGEPAHLADASAPFVRTFVIGLPFALSFMALRGFVLALKRPKATMVVILGAVVVNAVLDYMLIFGHFGMPRLGMVGSGIASACAFVFEFTALLTIILATPEMRAYRIFRRFFRPDWGKLAEIFRLGMPIGFSMIFEVLFFNSGAFIIGHFGTSALAAHQIALNVVSIIFMVPMGLGMAASVRIGLAAGARDSQGVRRAGVTALSVGAGLMLAIAATIALFPRHIAGLYVDANAPENAALIANAVLYLRAAALFELFDGLQVIAIHSLRGLKDAKVPAVMAGIAYWAVGFPAAFLLSFTFGMGGLGVWIAFVLSLIAAAGMLLWRFAYKTAIISVA